MSTIRGYVGTNISADTGEVVVIASPLVGGFHLAPGTQEDIVTMRMRMKTNTAFAGGNMLATVRWNDGNADQQWDVSLTTDPGNYGESGLEIWMDGSRDLTIQVLPLVAGGSVDVLLDYVEL
jgi:hypothetical protein